MKPGACPHESLVWAQHGHGHPSAVAVRSANGESLYGVVEHYGPKRGRGVATSAPTLAGMCAISGSRHSPPARHLAVV
eukprot:scaffold94058_cov63-Phaeocystis_antarctica.AAC.2